MTSTSTSTSYERRRSSLEEYFDRTAADAWAKLTSDAPVSKIRATVRAGRDRMRGTLLDWLPQDLYGRRVLDAGCGTGALAVEAARRGATVIAVDLSGTLLATARERMPEDVRDRLTFMATDMLDPSLGTFDHVVAMDSLIHYRTADMVEAVSKLAARTGVSMLFTFAPSTPALRAMHTVGKLFPRGNKSPAIEPVAARALKRRLTSHTALEDFALSRDALVKSGFYISHAQEVARA